MQSSHTTHTDLFLSLYVLAAAEAEKERERQEEVERDKKRAEEDKAKRQQAKAAEKVEFNYMHAIVLSGECIARTRCLLMISMIYRRR